MRSRQPERADPAFLNEKTARKQAERRLLLDALDGGIEAAPIEWAPGDAVAIAPTLPANPSLRQDADPEAAAERQNRS